MPGIRQRPRETAWYGRRCACAGMDGETRDGLATAGRREPRVAKTRLPKRMTGNVTTVVRRIVREESRDSRAVAAKWWSRLPPRGCSARARMALGPYSGAQGIVWGGREELPSISRSCRRAHLARSKQESVVRGKPHAAFDAAGAGNVAGSRSCDTRRRKGEQQGTPTST